MKKINWSVIGGVSILVMLFLANIDSLKDAFLKKEDTKAVNKIPLEAEKELLKPVVLSWIEAATYCNWLSQKEGLLPLAYKITEKGVERDSNSKGYRLPTEAEWEYAANGGVNNKQTKFAGNNDYNGVAVVISMNEVGKLELVGSRKPNSLDLCDMSGNVWEWVEDCWNDNYKKWFSSSFRQLRLWHTEGGLLYVR